jgi:hypothetical protein
MNMKDLAIIAWQQYHAYSEHPDNHLVTGSIPILYFGDHHAFEGHDMLVVWLRFVITPVGEIRSDFERERLGLYIAGIL